MGKYYEADESIKNLVDDLVDNRFRNLAAATIKVIMYSKPKIDKLRGAMVFASIKPANQVERYLSKNGYNLDGVDYLIFVNDLVWELANLTDRKRILSHELRHAFIDDKGNYKVVNHDIEDFFDEVTLNKDDPMWGQALSTIAMAKYEQMKADAKSKK